MISRRRTREVLSSGRRADLPVYLERMLPMWCEGAHEDESKHRSNRQRMAAQDIQRGGSRKNRGRDEHRVTVHLKISTRTMTETLLTADNPAPCSPMAAGPPLWSPLSGGVDSSQWPRCWPRAITGHRIDDAALDQRRLASVDPGAPRRPGPMLFAEDVYDARRVAEPSELSFYVVNLSGISKRRDIRPFVSEYLQGRTPIRARL